MKRLKQEKNTETLRLRHEWKNQLLSLQMFHSLSYIEYDVVLQ